MCSITRGAAGYRGAACGSATGHDYRHARPAIACPFRGDISIIPRSCDSRLFARVGSFCAMDPSAIRTGARMKTGDIEDIYELSPLQQGILFHSLYDGDSDIYVNQRSARLFRTHWDESMRRSFDRVVE